MSYSRFFPLTLAAAVLVCSQATPASALTAYDARTLGMGGSSVGYAANASLAFWNPAAVGNNTKWNLFLPTFGVVASNNILGVGDLTQLPTLVGGGAAGLAPLLAKLGTAEGLNLQEESVVELLGLATPLGKVGPGSLAVRVYAHNVGMVRASLSPGLAADISNLFDKDKGLTAMATKLQAISTASSKANANTPAAIKQDVADLRNLINGSMQSLLKAPQSITADSNVGANGVVAATYAMPIPLKLRPYPNASLSLGATAKVFGGVPIPNVTKDLPSGSGNSTQPINLIGMSTQVKLDVDQELTALLGAIDEFQKSQDPTLAATVDVIDKSTKLLEDGLGKKSSLGFSSYQPSGAGVGVDLGAHFRFDRWWALGLSLVNPIMIWPTTKTDYQYVFGANGITLRQTGTSSTNNWAAEPMMVRFGGAFTPQLQGKGNPILVNDILVTAGLESAIITGTNLPVRPAISLGLEKLFGPIALRVGTQQLGFSPFYTAGLGVQTAPFQLNLAAGVDNPGNIKGAALSLTLGSSF